MKNYKISLTVDNDIIREFNIIEGICECDDDRAPFMNEEDEYLESDYYQDYSLKCVSKSTDEKGRKSCRDIEIVQAFPGYVIDQGKDGIVWSTIHERGTGSGFREPVFTNFEEFEVTLPNGQTVSMPFPTSVILEVNARGGGGQGERGRIEGIATVHFIKMR